MIKKNPEVLVFKGMEEISDFIIKLWIKISKKAIKERDKFIVAISGGKTPITFYRRLSNSASSLSWNKTYIFLVDERFVPFKNPESNYKMLRKNILSRIHIPEGNIHPVYIKETAEISAITYEEDIIRFFNLTKGGLPTFDLIMLGIGEDGHTASLFPGGEALFEKSHLTRAVSSDRLKNKRITITLPLINQAKNIVFLVTGINKARIIKEILIKNNSQSPASLVKSRKGKTFFLLDTEAASLL